MQKPTSILFGLFTLLFVLLLTQGCQPPLPDTVAEAYAQLPDEIDFSLHVKPILSDKCFACHGPDNGKRESGLRLDVAEAAFGELPESPGLYAIDPGNLRSSEVFHRILTQDPGLAMPPPEFKVELTAYEKAVLVRWIEEGAEYKKHWAFIPPEAPKVPKVDRDLAAHNPVDNFVLDKLEEKGLQPVPEADKPLLLRRLSLDLTGLPPTPQEIEAFLADESEDAYEKQVDRLLASPHYGEKMATDWMDLARYADTYGYQVDRYRDMSPWRDWVIKAFNENMPYDQFVSWQLAGDMMPDATREQILATGFNRLHPQNMEGGIVDEEFRVEYVADRVAILGDGLMGLTLSCAKCHDHKYDPISQKEYYQFFSFFNNLNETGQISWDTETPVPTLMLPTSQQQATLRDLQQTVSQTEQKLAEVSESEKEQIEDWIQKAGYQQINKIISRKGQTALYALNGSLANQLAPSQRGKMDREFSPREVATFVAGKNGRGLHMDGDAWLDLKGVGVFKRNQPFSIGLWAWFPKKLEEGVIFHKNKGTRLHSYRGYHLYLKNNRLEWMMAHTWPENAIIEHSLDTIPREEWVHLMVTYDGSSRAAGSRMYLNGKELETSIEKDQLSKDIIFHDLRDVIYAGPIEPNLQIGARWRGFGIRDAKVDEITVFERELTGLEVYQMAKPAEAFTYLQTDPTHLQKADRDQLAQYFLTQHSSDYQSLTQELYTQRLALVDSMEKVQEVMVMREMDTARHTFVLNRGVYDDYGERVFPATAESVLPFPKNLPQNRLGLAQWLFLPNHPLTARVAVNRYWQQYFGQGLVTTTQDFGNQGALPSHPELLDWLAIRFQESGWDIKALQRLIVSSATYRQSSYASPEMREQDKANVWLARGPEIRLTSEMLRDNVLAASGLLNTEIGGESVRPYQPDGLWKMNGGQYKRGDSSHLYRRSFYTLWKRTVPNPTLATFDQPDRNICTVRRQKTNTPLQALVMLNDPTFLEAAKVMGEQMAKQPDPESGIRTAYLQLTGKHPTPPEMKVLLSLQQQEYDTFQNIPGRNRGWLEAGEYLVDPSLDPDLVASHAVVASVILNSDATITKR